MQFIWAQWQKQIEVNWNRQWPFKREIECWAVGGIDTFWCSYCVSFGFIRTCSLCIPHSRPQLHFIRKYCIDVSNYFQHLILDFFIYSGMASLERLSFSPDIFIFNSLKKTFDFECYVEYSMKNDTKLLSIFAEHCNGKIYK